MGAQYDPRSLCADEFINDEEILETLAYATRISTIWICATTFSRSASPICTRRPIMGHDHASRGKRAFGLRKQGRQRCIKRLAHDVKQAYYGNRIVLFAPLYLSNYCVNGCLYCPYHAKNREIPRRKLTQDEIRAEVIALQDMGHKRLAIEAGEDPKHNPIEYILNRCAPSIP